MRCSIRWSSSTARRAHRCYPKATPIALLIAGQSGVGKSSLVRAGVLPQLGEVGLGDGRAWTGCTLVPGAHPLTTLVVEIDRHTRRAARNGDDGDAVDTSFTDELTADIDAASQRVRTRLGERAGLMVFVDQLEELVTLSDPEEARAASQALAGLSERTPGVRFLATVRADKLAELAALPGLGNLVERALHILRPLGEEGIRQAVVAPAHAKGVRFESEALVTTLVQSTLAAQGGLPLLQFALSELWDARDVQRGLVLDHALDALGGVSGALTRHADSVLSALLPERRQAARKLLMRLVTLHATRDRHSEDELVAGNETRRDALRALVTAGFDGTARVWNTGQSAHRMSLSSFESPAQSAAFRADGAQIATGHMDGLIRVWDRSGTQLFTLDTRSTWPDRSSSGKMILSWSPDGHRRHAQAVRSARFSTDGKLLVLGCEDRTATIWTEDGTLRMTLQVPATIASTAFSPGWSSTGCHRGGGHAACMGYELGKTTMGDRCQLHIPGLPSGFQP